MLGDTEIETTVPSPTPAPEPVTQMMPPKPKSSVLPILFGFLLVMGIALGVGFFYYKNILTASPSPSPSVESSPSPVSSIVPSSTPSASLKPKTGSTVIKASATPTATPFSQPSLDIRFGNPSANIKQTIDYGQGQGRVINREYTSIQAGQFDEVSSSWSPRVTVCFHVVANEDISGKNLKFTFSLDDKVEVEDNFGQYDKMEAGRMYDWCHDVTTSISKHTAKLLINPDKSLKEFNYVNDLARLDWENLADKIAPNFTLGGPYDWTDNDKGTCFLIISPSDNINTIAELKIEQKIDTASWVTYTGAEYCFDGTTGDSHSYGVKITDTRGNVNEQNRSFVLY